MDSTLNINACIGSSLQTASKKIAKIFGCRVNDVPFTGSIAQSIAAAAININGMIIKLEYYIVFLILITMYVTILFKVVHGLHRRTSIRFHVGLSDLNAKIQAKLWCTLAANVTTRKDYH